MMKKNIYQSQEAVLEKVVDETPNIKTLVLKPKTDFSFKAGQFIELSVPGQGEAPFTPSSSPHVKERLEVTVMSVGKITGILHNLKPESTLGIRGPLGNAYPLEKFVNKEILIVGGGVGLAPLRSLFLALTYDMNKYKKIVFCYGARTPDDVVYKHLILNEWLKLSNKINFRLTVDKAEKTGWNYQTGVVTCTLDKLDLDMKNTVSIVCGPPIMMKFSTLKLLELGFSPANIYLSMEKNMSCGVGKCGHCQMGKYYVCKDGPVFTYEQIKDIHELWD